jgi:dienelactone hydrolase
MKPKGQHMWKLALALNCLPLAAFAQTEVSFPATDGVTLFADIYPHSGAQARGMILLFHQASGNSAEYAAIAPHLAELGFDALAVDQRAGGNLFGGNNRTVAAIGHSATYDAAYPDLEGALAYATASGGKAIIWGSSYSSALTLVLAARNPDKVMAALAFSPDEYLATMHVATEVPAIAMPVFLTANGTDAEMAAVEAIVVRIPPGLASVYDPQAGKHGSSTLRQDANPGGWVDNWVPVEAFLDRVAP